MNKINYSIYNQKINNYLLSLKYRNENELLRQIKLLIKLLPREVEIKCIFFHTFLTKFIL